MFAQSRRTMKNGPVKIWVATSQRFQSLGDEGGRVKLGEFVSLLDWWPGGSRGLGAMWSEFMEVPFSGSTILIEGDPVP